METYTFVYSVDLGKAVPEVGRAMNSVNDTLSACGHRQQVCVRSPIGEVSVKLSRPLTKPQEEGIGQMILDDIREKFPDLEIRLDEVRHKSGKSCRQSISR